MASLEEVLGLLNNWMMQGCSLIAISAGGERADARRVSEGPLVRVSGTVTAVNFDDATFTFSVSEEDFIIACLKYCGFGYDEKLPLPETLADYVAASTRSLLIIKFMNGSTLCLFAAPDDAKPN